MLFQHQKNVCISLSVNMDHHMLFLFPLISSPTLPLVSNHPWNGFPHQLPRAIHVKSHVKPEGDQEMTPSPACLWSSLLWVWNSVCPLSFKPVSFALWFQDFSQDIMLLGVSLLPLRLTGKWRLLSTLLNPMSSFLGSWTFSLIQLFLLLLYSHCQFHEPTATVRAGWQSVTEKRFGYQTAKVLKQTW